MTDLTFTRSGEFDVVHVEGNTDNGIEFVDAWMRDTTITVIDAGRIIITPANAGVMMEVAREGGLSFDVIEKE